MTMTTQERVWLRKHIVSRKVEQDQELKDLGSRNAVTGLTTKAKDDLAAHLKQTGRAGDETTAAAKAARAKAKDDHQADVLERVEEGINARRIEDQEARRVDSGTRRVAAEKPGTQFDAGRIAGAKGAVDDQQARRDIAIAAIERQLQAKATALFPTIAFNDLSTDQFHKVMGQAIEHVADATGLVMVGADREAYLAHFASRHGSKTTLDDQIARPITGVPADMRNDTMAKTTVTLHDGSTANIPTYAAFGKFDDVSSRLASGEAGLYMLEESLIQAQELDRFDRKADSYALDLLTTNAEGFGEGVSRVNATAGGLSNSAYDGFKMTGVIPLAQRATRFQGRAAGLKKELNIKGAKVILDRALEGGYVAKTMFPDRRVENAGRERITTGPQSALVDEVAAKYEQQQRVNEENEAKAALTRAELLGGKGHADPQASDKVVTQKQKVLGQHVESVAGADKQAKLMALAQAAADVKTLQARKVAWDAAALKVSTAEAAARVAFDARNTAKQANDVALNAYKLNSLSQSNNATKIAKQKDLLDKERVLEAGFNALDAARAELEALRPFVADPATLQAQLDAANNARTVMLAEAKAVVGDLPVLGQVEAAAADLQTTRLAERGLAKAAQDEAERNAEKKADARKQKVEAFSPGGTGRKELKEHVDAALKLKDATDAFKRIDDAETRLAKLKADRAATAKNAADELALYKTAEANALAAPNDVALRKLLVEAKRKLAAADTRLAQEQSLEQNLAEFLAANAVPSKVDLEAARKQAEDALKLTATSVAQALKPADPTAPVPDTAAMLAELETAVRDEAAAKAAAQSTGARAQGAQAMAEVAKAEVDSASERADVGRKVLVKAHQQAVADGKLTAGATDDAKFAYLNDLPAAARAKMEDQVFAEETATRLAAAQLKQKEALTEAAKPLSTDVPGAAAKRVEAVAKAQQAEIDAYRLWMQDGLDDRAAQLVQHNQAADDVLKQKSDAQAALDGEKKVVADAKTAAQDKAKLHADAVLLEKKLKDEFDSLELARQAQKKIADDAATAATSAETERDKLKTTPTTAVQQTLTRADEKTAAAKLAGEKAKALQTQAAEAKGVADGDAATAKARQTEAADANKDSERLAGGPGEATEAMFAKARTLEEDAAKAASALTKLQRTIDDAQVEASRARQNYEKLRDKAGAGARITAAQQQLQSAQAALATLDAAGQEVTAKEISGLQQRLQKLQQDAQVEGDASAAALEKLRADIAANEQKAQSGADQLEAAGTAVRDAQAAATAARVTAEEARGDELETARARLQKAQDEAAKASTTADKSKQAQDKLDEAATEALDQQAEDESAANELREEAKTAQAAALQTAEEKLVTARDVSTQEAAALKTAADDATAKQNDLTTATQATTDALKTSEQAKITAADAETTQKPKIEKAEAGLRQASKDAEESERVRRRVQDEVADDKRVTEAQLARAEAEQQQRLADTLRDPANPLSVAQADLAARRLERAKIEAEAADAERLLHIAQHDREARSAAHLKAKSLYDNAKAQVDKWVASGVALTDVQKALQARLPLLLKSQNDAAVRLAAAGTQETAAKSADDAAKLKVAPAETAVTTAEAEVAKQQALLAKGPAQTV